MVQPVVPNQYTPRVPPQEVLDGPHFVHVLPRELSLYHILVYSLQVGGELL